MSEPTEADWLEGRDNWREVYGREQVTPGDTDSGYTPSMNVLEELFVVGIGKAFGTNLGATREQFRNALAAHDAEVAEKAWDGGEKAGRKNGDNWNGWDYDYPEIVNPYRDQMGEIK